MTYIPNPKSTEEMMDDLIETMDLAGMAMEFRIFFNDEEQTVQRQVCVNENWIGVSKREHIPYDKEYFARKLIGK